MADEAVIRLHEPQGGHRWAVPYVWRDPATLPRRQHLYGKHLTRKFLSTTVAAGGVGKSSLTLAEAAALASGKPLLGVDPGERRRVWYFNGEDPADEPGLRLAAIGLRYNLDRDDLEGWLYLGAGRKDPLIIATQTRDGALIQAPNVDAVTAMMRDLRIDVAIIDPFVSTHHVSENDNGAINEVAQTWAKIADDTDAAIDVVHHLRKLAGREATVEDSRGAVALIAAARSARVLNVMTEEEGQQAGVADHRSYFRADNGKANLGPPPRAATWFRIDAEPLGNGDAIGVVTSWAWPDPFAGVTVAHLFAVQTKISQGDYRADPQAKGWAGEAVAEVLGLSTGDKADNEKAKRLLARWEAEGLFGREDRMGEDRKRHPYLTVRRWASL